MRFQFSLRQLLVQTLLFSIIGAYLVMLRYDPRALAASFSAFAVFALLASAKKSNHKDDRSWPLAMYYSFALAVTAATAFGAELWLAGEKPPARNGSGAARGGSAIATLSFCSSSARVFRGWQRRAILKERRTSARPHD